LRTRQHENPPLPPSRRRRRLDGAGPHGAGPKRNSCAARVARLPPAPRVVRRMKRAGRRGRAALRAAREGARGATRRALQRVCAAVRCCAMASLSLPLPLPLPLSLSLSLSLLLALWFPLTLSRRGVCALCGADAETKRASLCLSVSPCRCTSVAHSLAHPLVIKQRPRLLTLFSGTSRNASADSAAYSYLLEQDRSMQGLADYLFMQYGPCSADPNFLWTKWTTDDPFQQTEGDRETGRRRDGETEM
jgi:hypothetical protein